MRKLPLLMIAWAVASGVALTAGGALAADDTEAASSTGSEHPDATLTLIGGSFAAGIGIVWGQGDLIYQDKTHHFSISGVTVIDAGVAEIEAEGQVYHLKNLADFAGSYTVTSAGASTFGGGSATYMKNKHGVVIKLSSTDEGVRFHLSMERVKVKLDE